MDAGQSRAERGDELGVSSSHLGAQNLRSHLSQEPKTPCPPSSSPRAELFLLPILRGRSPFALMPREGRETMGSHLAPSDPLPSPYRYAGGQRHLEEQDVRGDAARLHAARLGPSPVSRRWGPAALSQPPSPRRTGQTQPRTAPVAPSTLCPVPMGLPVGVGISSLPN